MCVEKYFSTQYPADPQKIPILLDTPGAKHFISYEPALGRVKLNQLERHETFGDGCYIDNALTGFKAFYNMDCMEGMKRFPDKFFELAIVDPPYGIGRDGSKMTTSKHGGRKAHKFKGWDSEIPSEQYFNELRRVSKNQIIWGANYFTKYLPQSMGWVFWDKGQRICNSDGELAFTSFQRALRVVDFNRVELLKEGTIHPTQKPISLYKWLLVKYAQKGDKILDTHVGSGSSLIACYELGFDYMGFELDPDYFWAATKRIEAIKAQGRLF